MLGWHHCCHRHLGCLVSASSHLPRAKLSSPDLTPGLASDVLALFSPSLLRALSSLRPASPLSRSLPPAPLLPLPSTATIDYKARQNRSATAPDSSWPPCTPPHSSNNDHRQMLLNQGCYHNRRWQKQQQQFAFPRNKDRHRLSPKLQNICRELRETWEGVGAAGER